MPHTILIATIIIGSWLLGAIYAQHERSIAEYQRLCDQIDVYHIMASQGYAPELRGGVDGERC